MAHVFDSGLEGAQRTLIRNAVAARLADLRKSARTPMYIADIRSLPRRVYGRGDIEGKGMLADAFQGQAPAIAIALGRMSLDRAGTDPLEHVGGLEVVVYVASTHSRDGGMVDGRLEADVVAGRVLTVDPGIDVMLEHVRERLLGQSLGLQGVGELEGIEEDEAASWKELTVWFQTYRVSLDIVPNPARNTTAIVAEVENRIGLDGVSGDLNDPDPDAFVTTLTPLDQES